ncbi:MULTISPECIES: DUF2004 domain-containing protein [Kitasatospora]|uniref:DUF2004 domain-containing protein n=1 Tax=Kitasatospora setae (strain ATCC 33774 / DSM 43861 / JCM 3304 / KCC A-0304 / NBRC 14216 / KM-6054) TaxID=452652 RepID=E4N1G7_KITSK|nr:MULTISPECIES: DUF2004 domain-containing protein [Kitasatospora]BAJ32001.1 hypothetical protein KSE_62370 [Kitasatospora setae KM-6054]
MATIEHPHFGRLETGATGEPDAVWTGTARLGADEVGLLLWAGPGPGPDTAELDALAARLADPAALDAAARAALRTYLLADRLFIDHHVEELPDSPAVRHLLERAADGQVGVDAFLAALRLRTIGLWPAGLADGPPIVLDYVFEPALSDQILAVRATADGTVTAVDWES